MILVEIKLGFGGITRYRMICILVIYNLTYFTVCKRTVYFVVSTILMNETKDSTVLAHSKTKNS